MKSAIHRFLTYMEQERGCAENTLLAYGADLQQFAQVLTKGGARATSPAALGSDSLSGYGEWLAQQGYQGSTVSRKMAAVRSFLSYLNEWEGLENAQLVDELHSPPTQSKEPRVLSQKEASDLLSAPARFEHPRALRDRAILELLYATGLRAAEVVALTLDDVDLALGIIFRTPTRDQPVPLGGAAEAMRQYLQKGRPHLARNPQIRAYFLSQRGQSLSRQGLWLIVKRWSEAAGLGRDISPHTLRHTLIRNLLEKGKTRKEVQHFLGLSSPNAIRMGRKTQAEENRGDQTWNS